MTTDPLKIAYAAGLFDGEGSVIIMPGRTFPSRALQARIYICLSQVDQRPLIWLRTHFGGKIRQKKSYHARARTPYEWYLLGNPVEQFLRAVRPFLTLKTAQADLAFQFRATMQPSKGGIVIPLSPAIIAERERMYQTLKVLNQRGAAYLAHTPNPTVRQATA